MERNFFKAVRNSRMSLGEVYFWTNTTKDWKPLLKKDSYKELIIEQLQWLKKRNKIVIYGLVIMPNHVHVLWELLDKMEKKCLMHLSISGQAVDSCRIFASTIRKYCPYLKKIPRKEIIDFGKKIPWQYT